MEEEVCIDKVEGEMEKEVMVTCNRNEEAEIEKEVAATHSNRELVGRETREEEIYNNKVVEVAKAKEVVDL